MFCWNFVNFWSFETLKIVLPSKRNANFHKIHVFASRPKIDRKIIEKFIQKSTKKRNKSSKKRVWQHIAFQRRFLVILATILDPELAQNFGFFSDFFGSWAKMGPRAPQEAPRGLQEWILTDFGLHFERFLASFFWIFCNFFFVVLGFGSCTCPGSCASYLSLPLRLGGDIPRQQQSGAWAISMHRSLPTQHGVLRQQASQMRSCSRR